GEIEALARLFLERAAQALGRTAPVLAPEALALLQRYSWPGNIRELKNVMERATLLCTGSRILPDNLPTDKMKATFASLDAPPQFEEYRLLRVLGRGAMGTVWLAHDLTLDRPVAIKFVAGARDRFFLEARAVARLHHPNVATIHRVGEVDGHPYIVSEYVRGT